MMVLVACSDDEVAIFENTFPNADMSDYEIEGEHRFYQVTMYEALQLRENEAFNGILYFGGAWCPWCQVAIPIMHEVSLATGVDIFYVSRAHVYREGEWLEWDASMAWWLYENDVANMRWLDEEGDLVDVGDEEEYGYRPNINVPQIVHLRAGNVVDSHRGTFDGHDMEGEGANRHLPEMTDAEIATLIEVYTRIFSEAIIVDACGLEPVDGGCS